MFVLPDIQLSEDYLKYENILTKSDQAVVQKFYKEQPVEAKKAKTALSEYFSKTTAKHYLQEEVQPYFTLIEENGHFKAKPEGEGKFKGLTLAYLKRISEVAKLPLGATTTEFNTIQKESGYILTHYLIDQGICHNVVQFLATPKNAFLKQILVNNKVAVQDGKLISAKHCDDYPFAMLRYVRTSK